MINNNNDKKLRFRKKLVKSEIKSIIFFVSITRIRRLSTDCYICITNFTNNLIITANDFEMCGYDEYANMFSTLLTILYN